MITTHVLAAAALILVGIGAPQQVPTEAERTIAGLQANEIASNVPDETKFASFLKRDLEAYFVSVGIHDPSVRFELLRKEPTQTGVSYPKFYLWVWIRSGNKPVLSGAVRVAAINKKRFEVTNFLKREDILSDEKRAGQIFPAALASSIQMRAGSGAGPDS